MAPLLLMPGVPGSQLAMLVIKRWTVAGFGAGENMGMASMPLPLPWRETAKLYEIPDT